MKRIKSFEIDHTKLMPGIYISRTDGDTVTYDLRTRLPNSGNYMDYDAIHTIEHLFATYVRNSEYTDKIIYFGPMGCRTGFYFIVSGMNRDEVIALVKETIKFIADYSGEIPGATEKECGNYREHNLEKAKEEAARYYSIVKNWDIDRLKYPE
ncbi:MAG TPA: S-ribosylhomocysteine lyase [Firmicutes bacterium]|nr:S-ribosylhomocysteine lyase [Bacillota bacterium]